jgi:hypothetical protein
MPLPLVVKTDAFEDGGIVPARYGCFGGNVQPGFVFNNVPENAANLALLFHDIDVALDGSPEDRVHWTVWNIPPDEGGLPEGMLPPGAVAGRNVENRNAYLGPGAATRPALSPLRIRIVRARSRARPTADGGACRATARDGGSRDRKGGVRRPL